MYYQNSIIEILEKCLIDNELNIIDLIKNPTLKCIENITTLLSNIINNVLDIDEFKMLMLKFHISDYNNIQEMFNEADLNGDGILTIDEFMMFLSKNDSIAEKLKEILDYKFKVKKKHDKRTLLFKDFPGSPLKNDWRPSLNNLNSMEFIKKHI